MTTTVAHGKHHSFQYPYLECYRWLGYSVNLDACLCLPSSLFGEAGDAQNFAWNPVTNWTTFNNKVKAHSTCPTHIKCASTMVSFIQIQSENYPTINTALGSRRQELYHHKSKWLNAIIDCIILCGKQNILLRGHCDANCSLHNATNNGNFQAIVEIRALGDPVLQQHPEHGQKNAEYTSPRTQNENHCYFQIDDYEEDSWESKKKWVVFNYIWWVHKC